MTQLEDRVFELDKEIAGVVKDQEIQNRAAIRMEETIDRLQVLAESMHRLIAIHDERINYNSKINDTHIAQSESQREVMLKDIRELSDRLERDKTDLSQKMEAMETRLSNKIDNVLRAQKEDHPSEDESLISLKKVVDKWRWVIIAIVFILGQQFGAHNIIAAVLKYFA